MQRFLGFSLGSLPVAYQWLRDVIVVLTGMSGFVGIVQMTVLVM